MRGLRSPVWQFIGVVVALVALGVTVALYLNSRPIRRLRVDVLSNSPLVSVDTGVAKEMQILYRGRSVQTLSVILLKLANTGNQPIAPSDYSEPIRVSVSSSAAIGEVVVQETRPGGIGLSPTVNNLGQVELAPVLLNPGDQAVVKILALNNDTTLKISARIAGVRELEVHSVFERNDKTTQVVGTWIYVALLGPMALLILFALLWQTRATMEWRKTRFGFDPARYFYEMAQTSMLMPKKDSTVAQVIGYLDKAFSWDGAYLERAKNDPLFSAFAAYQPFQDLLSKYAGEVHPT